MNDEAIQKVLDEYVDNFGELPMIPMMQCSGYSDPQYIAMLQRAIKTGEKVSQKDYEDFFPFDPDVLY
jgi:hypothetical protein